MYLNRPGMNWAYSVVLTMVPPVGLFVRDTPAIAFLLPPKGVVSVCEIVLVVYKDLGSPRIHMFGFLCTAAHYACTGNHIVMDQHWFEANDIVYMTDFTKSGVQTSTLSVLASTSTLTL